MSHLGNSPSNSTACPLGSWRTFEGIVLSPRALLSPDGKLHSRPFTRKRKAESPPSDDTGRNVQAEPCKYAEADLPTETRGERRIGLSCQPPVAAIIPPKEPNTDEWWTALGNSSLDVSAILQRAFFKPHTGTEAAKQDGFRLADMVTSVSASCGLSCSAIWSAPAQQQRVRRCIEQTVADHCLLSATEQASVRAPFTVAGKPTNHDGQQALPCSQTVLGVHNGDRSQIHGHCSSKAPCDAGKTSRRAQKPAHVGTSLPVWPVASASGRRLDTAQEGVPCTTDNIKLEPTAFVVDAAVEDEPKGIDAAAWTQEGCAVPLGQPVPAAQKASKRLKPTPAMPARVEAAVCKQEDIQTTCNDAQADHATRGLSSERRAQSISAPSNPALHHLIREMSPQKPRSRWPESAPQSHTGLRSQTRGRRQGAKHASSSFQSAAAASEMTANTAQREALHRLLESTKRCNWGSHRSIKQINNDYRSHVNYKPQSGYS
ncbi:hypothetical protein ABBQ38_003108 [Trebouxia sp. C0009 RCD-2024]